MKKKKKPISLECDWGQGTGSHFVLPLTKEAIWYLTRRIQESEGKVIEINTTYE